MAPATAVTNAGTTHPTMYHEASPAGALEDICRPKLSSERPEPFTDMFAFMFAVFEAFLNHSNTTQHMYTEDDTDPMDK